jgi:putative iron-dependent peroxidase
VLSPLTAAAIFLVVTVNHGGEDTVRDLLPDVAGLQRSVGFRIPGGGLQVVAAIGSSAWDRLSLGPRPAELHPFQSLAGPRHRAPATPGDLLFHIRASRMDLCFEFAAQVMARLTGAATVADEVHGFRYFDERDLIGFVDGTESPGGAAAVGAAIVGEADPDFAGGSYVIVQKYLHDIPGWNALPVEDQEKAVGRSKLDDIEMPDDVKPANSHVALNTVTGDDGEERQIVRANMPFGDAGRGEFGTYFIGYAATPSVTEQMLANMFIGRPAGNTDRILDFSTAVTGGLFFAPSADFLDDLPEPPAATQASQSPGVPDSQSPGVADSPSPGMPDSPSPGTPASPSPGIPASRSLGIGSLKGQ